MPLVPLLHTQRLMKGSGHEWGGLVTEIINSDPHRALRVLYLETVPWYFRVFLHTLSVENGGWVRVGPVDVVWAICVCVGVCVQVCGCVSACVCVCVCVGMGGCG